jgi:hypothetical protein
MSITPIFTTMFLRMEISFFYKFIIMMFPIKNGFNGKQKERVFILTRSHLLFREVVK